MQVPYSNVVGNLMYVIICTILDISQVINMMSRYVYNPNKGCWLSCEMDFAI